MELEFILGNRTILREKDWSWVPMRSDVVYLPQDQEVRKFWVRSRAGYGNSVKIFLSTEPIRL